MDVEERSESRQRQTKSRRRRGSEEAGARQPPRGEMENPVGAAHPAGPQQSHPAARISRPQFQTGDMRGIVDAAEHIADDLRPQFPETAQYLSGAAAGLKRVLDLVDEPGVVRLANGVRDLARAQPALFVAGAMLTGIVLWRVFGASIPATGGPSDNNR